MQNLIHKIKTYEEQANLLEIPLVDREATMNKVNNYVNQFIDSLPKSKAYLNKEVNESKLQITEKQKSIDEILAIFQSEVAENGINGASGGHVGFIPGGGIYSSALADYLAAVSNAYVGVTHASPGGVAIENAVLTWLKDIFGFPQTAIGNLASGGSISNLIALTAARDKYQIKNEKITQSVIYMSEQVHHCIHKSLRIIGLEDVIIRYIPLDEYYHIQAFELDKLIQDDKVKGLNPFLVIASAGTTDVGAVDPLDAIAEIAKQHQLWYHIDAAYGGFFVMSSKKHLLKGIEKADSLVVDPHKGMFLPFGLGAVLIKDVKSVLRSNLYTANYMQDSITDDLAHQPSNVSPELTKHFRSLRLWLPLQLHGEKPFIANLEEKLLLTQYFRKKLVELGFNIGPEPDLSVSYFWYPHAKNSNEFNKLLTQYIHEDGSVFLSSTTLKGQFVIRMAILSFRTKLSTIDRALAMIKTCLKKTLKEFED